MGQTSLSLSGGKLSLLAKWVGISAVCFGMASCATTTKQEAPQKTKRSKEYFSEKDYGVKASPRVVREGQSVPKGGGRFMVGDPYQVRGKTYVPKEDPRYNKNGLASWYGSAFHGRLTANGEVYDSSSMTAAHPTFPLPSYARVTNLDNGSSMIVRVNDRGPYHAGRIIDVSEKTAQLLDIKRAGTANVNVQYVGRARMDGHDEPYLMASYIRKGDRLPRFQPEGQIATGVMVASNRPLGDDLQSYGSPAPRQPAYAGRSSSTAVPAPVARSQQVQRSAPIAVASLPPAAPQPIDRPLNREIRQPVRAVASAAPVEPQRQVRPASQQMQVANSGLHPIAPQARQPQPQSSATAYAGEARSKGPVVMFGNMVLQDSGPGQKPVR